MKRLNLQQKRDEYNQRYQEKRKLRDLEEQNGSHGRDWRDPDQFDEPELIAILRGK